MVKLERFDIVLTKPKIVYFPGETVDGEILIRLNRATKIKGITVKCRGCCEVFWAEAKETDQNSVSSYHATEDYLDSSKAVLESATGEDSLELEAGSHAFPFKFLLPNKLPVSFEGRPRCYVRYWVKGIIEKPWKHNKEIKQAFTVGGTLDLNRDSKAKSKVTKEGIKTIGTWCCETGPAYGKLSLARTGYVPGEHISCNAEISDGTGHGVTWTKVRLMMTATYHGPKKAKTSDTKQISMIQHGPINPGFEDEYDSEKILIPPLPPSHLPGCNLIDITYNVELWINVKDIEPSLKVKTDIIIGTVPLHSVVQNLLKPPISKHINNNRNQTVTQQPQRANPDGEARISWPPTYRETVLGKADITDENDDENITGQLKFTPSYIYYDWIEKRQMQLEREPTGQTEQNGGDAV